MATVVLGILAMTLGAYGEEEKWKSSQLDVLKRLAGDWVGTAKHGDREMMLRSTIRSRPAAALSSRRIRLGQPTK